MSWRKETSADGLPIWRGKDSLYNVALTSEKTMAVATASGIGLGCIAGPLAIFLLFYGISTHAYGGGTWLLMCAGIVVAMIAIGFIGAFAVNGRSEFIGDEWQLVAAASSLQLKLKVGTNGRPLSAIRERWTVPIGAVARVETGRTTDYTLMRRYGAQTAEIPAHEWQVFLFMADGTRRVVYMRA